MKLEQSRMALLEAFHNPFHRCLTDECRAGLDLEAGTVLVYGSKFHRVEQHLSRMLAQHLLPLFPEILRVNLGGCLFL